MKELMTHLDVSCQVLHAHDGAAVVALEAAVTYRHLLLSTSRRRLSMAVNICMLPKMLKHNDTLAVIGSTAIICRQ